MVNKRWTLLLAAVLTLGLLTACGGGGDAPASSSDERAPAASSEAPEAVETSAAEFESSGNVDTQAIENNENLPEIYKKVVVFDVGAGLDLAAVNEYFGSEGVKDDESTVDEGCERYDWEAPSVKDGYNGNITVFFRDGKAYKVEQQYVYQAVLPLEKNQAKAAASGSETYEELRTALGGDGSLSRKEALDDGKIKRTYAWYREGSDGDWLSVEMTDNEVGSYFISGFTDK